MQCVMRHHSDSQVVTVLDHVPHDVDAALEVTSFDFGEFLLAARHWNDLDINQFIMEYSIGRRSGSAHSN